MTLTDNTCIPLEIKHFFSTMESNSLLVKGPPRTGKTFFHMMGSQTWIGLPDFLKGLSSTLDKASRNSKPIIVVDSVDALPANISK